MSDQNTPPTLTPEAEDALFQRLLKRLTDATHSAAAGIETAYSAIQGASDSAATSAREAASTAADQIAGHAKDAADFVQNYPGVLALAGLGTAQPLTLLAITALTAKKIVENRRSGSEPVAQILFRVPESLRDDVKRLSLDSKRQMDELLTEAVLDLLKKYDRYPNLLPTETSSN